MNTYIILRHAAWASIAELERSAGVAARVATEEMAADIRWIRSYVTSYPNGRIGMVCVYEATGEQAIRDHAGRACLPVAEIRAVQTTVLINEDERAAA